MKSLINFTSQFKILKFKKTSLIISALLGSATISFAAPSGGTVTSGTANISQNGNVTNINQSTSKASINWQNFSIAQNETVTFNQPDVNSITLNRVIGNEKSLINGALNANGQVWLLNSNGVLFGKNASVNTAGILASTAELSDSDFNAGNYNFKNSTSNSVINEGTIEVSNNGSVILASNEVQNSGTIKAVKGKVHLVGADSYSLNLNGNSLVNLKVDKGVLDSLVENSGTVIADGGDIYLTTNAVDELLRGVVNNTGIIEANSLDGVTGKVEVFAHGGTASVAGSITALDGFVETSGKEFKVDKNTNIKAKTWLIDPVNLTIDDALATTIETALGNGDVTIETDSPDYTDVDTGSNENGSDGNIYVNNEISTDSTNVLTLDAYNEIDINKTINTKGKVVFNANKINLKADIVTNSDQTYNADIILKKDITLDSSNNNGDITFSNTIDGFYNLTVNSGSGLINVNDNIGNTTKLYNLDLSSQNRINLNANVTTLGTQNYNSDLFLNSDVYLNSLGLSESSNSYSYTGELKTASFENGGLLTLTLVGGKGGSTLVNNTSEPGSKYSLLLRLDSPTTLQMAVGGDGATDKDGGVNPLSVIFNGGNGGFSFEAEEGAGGGAATVVEIGPESGIYIVAGGGYGKGASYVGKNSIETIANYTNTTSGGNGENQGLAGASGGGGGGGVKGGAGGLRGEAEGISGYNGVSGTSGVIDPSNTLTYSNESESKDFTPGISYSLANISSGITFNGKIDGTQSLKINVGNDGLVTFTDNIGSTNILKSIENTTTSGGKTIFDGIAPIDIKTNNTQSYHNVLINNDTTLNSTQLIIDEVNIENNKLATFKQSVNSTIDEVISGLGSLKKDGLGTLTLTGNNTYQGKTIIEQGSLVIKNDIPLTSSSIIEGTGNLTIEPSSNSFISSFSSSSWNLGNNLGALTIGSVTNTSDILLDNKTIRGNINVYGDDIIINNILKATNSGNIKLVGSGEIKDINNGYIESDALIVSADIVNLDNVNNKVGTLAADGINSITYKNSNSLITDVINSSGNIYISTLLGDLTINNSLSGNEIVLNIKDGNFINNSGSVTPFTSSLTSIYLPSYTNANLNNLVVDNKRYNTTYTDGCLFTDCVLPTTGVSMLYSIIPELTVTPTNGQTAVYGDDFASTYSISGYVDSDNVNSSGISGTTIFEAGAKSSSGNYIVDTHDVKYISGLLSSIGYIFKDDTSSNNEYTVTPKLITNITGITALNKIYDGSVNAILDTTNVSFDGILTNDHLTVENSTGKFDSKNVGDGKTVVISEVTFGGREGDNYSFSNMTASSNANITPKEINYSFGNEVEAGTSNGSEYLLSDLFQTSTLFADDSLLVTSNDYEFIYNGNAVTGFEEAGTYTPISLRFLNNNFALGNTSLDGTVIINNNLTTTAINNNRILDISEMIATIISSSEINPSIKNTNNEKNKKRINKVLDSLFKNNNLF